MANAKIVKNQQEFTLKKFRYFGLQHAKKFYHDQLLQKNLQ